MTTIMTCMFAIDHDSATRRIVLHNPTWSGSGVPYDAARTSVVAVDPPPSAAAWEMIEGWVAAQTVPSAIAATVRVLTSGRPVYTVTA